MFHRHHHHHGRPVVIVRENPPPRPVAVVVNPSPIMAGHHRHHDTIVIEDIHGTRIKDPHVPFIATLASGVHPGKKIVIDGQVEDTARWIAINLSCGPAIEENIALHVSIRGNEAVLVFNDRNHGHWGHEDRHMQLITCGMRISLKIHAKGDHFKVKLNGRHICDFHYRRALSEITHLQIEGGIRMHEVQIEKSKEHRTAYVTSSIPPAVALQPGYPAFAGSVASGVLAGTGAGYGAPSVPYPGPTAASTALSNASAPPIARGTTATAVSGFTPQGGYLIPYITVFPTAMAVGSQIHITGIPTLAASEITLSLKPAEPACMPWLAFALHLIIDFSQGAIIRNACLKGAWGIEERQLISQFPFVRGQPFRVILFCDHDGFKMAVNGVHLIHFAHRMHFSTVDTLEIRGDLNLSDVQFF